MKLTVFGYVMAVVMLCAFVVAVTCAVLILEEIGTPWAELIISAVICALLATAFNLEGRRK